MHIISHKALVLFAAEHSAAAGPLDDWYRTAKRAVWRSIVDTRRIYPHADAAGECTVFNIAGNKYRLVAQINYEKQTIYVRHIFTHDGYSKQYAKLLARTLPAVIESKQEYERLFREFDSLWKRQPELPPEEGKLLSLLVLLIEGYEARRHGLHASTPHSRLAHLMEARDLAQKDIWRLLGSRGVASEVIRGKRAISKSQAKKLAEFFHVTPDLFL